MRLLSDHIPSALGTLVIVVGDGVFRCAVDFDDCRRRMMAGIEARYGAVSLCEVSDPFGVSPRIHA